MHYFGIDLAWAEGTATRRANESGLALIDEFGAVLDAGWARGLDEVVDWIATRAAPGAVIAVDAPLVVHNAPKTMRRAEREVGVRYGRWGFSAYPSHTGLAWLAGVTLRERLESHSFRYTDGLRRNVRGESVMFECYPSTTIVGMEELGYDVAKPRYKGRDPKLRPDASRAARAVIADELIGRLGSLARADPPLDLRSHELTRTLLDEPSPTADAPYKHREDLFDAVICAWTASIWHRHGLDRVQILGADDEPDEKGRIATIVAPARPEHRGLPGV
ncbi:DUF429 domain-containing protein [Naasia lichenicola]|uniref:DUF429 domain-containing protein n=1 Tax=Naasia lichenicola TaxID=2565933 RepID=A0A4S4FUK7_9MICO|nr:DUF429 domain-containing protein [Naasia lichenicola]THG33296.1 DUF429 domain-containing protein [Naasia lichenicola]